MLTGSISSGHEFQMVTTSPTSYTAIPTDEFSDKNFPVDLYCSRISKPYIGPEWYGLVVGQSTLDDLISKLSKLDGKLSSFYENGLWRASFPEAVLADTPAYVDACISGNIVVAISVAPRQSIRLDDLVIRYGVPDAVTWTPSPVTRIVFWFGKGIGAEISALLDHPEFGIVDGIIYYPYQSPVDYQQRWPYKYTRDSYPRPDVIYSTGDTEKQNPFDFRAMLATITAQPSSAPTSTATTQPTRMATAALTPTATRTVEWPYFPDELDCSGIRAGEGPTWRGITVGRSRASEVRSQFVGCNTLWLPENQMCFLWRKVRQPIRLMCVSTMT